MIDLIWLFVFLNIYTYTYIYNVFTISVGNHEILKLEANECDGRCTIRKGKELSLDIEFVANQDTTKIGVAINAKLNGFNIPVPSTNTDVCTIIKCPLVKGQKYTFTHEYSIPAIVPTIKNAELTAKFTGDHGTLACLTLGGDITD